MKRNPESICKNCFFSIIKGTGVGEYIGLRCRRYPPTTIRVVESTHCDISAFSSVNEDDWCGEWANNK